MAALHSQTEGAAEAVNVDVEEVVYVVLSRLEIDVSCFLAFRLLCSSGWAGFDMCLELQEPHLHLILLQEKPQDSGSRSDTTRKDTKWTGSMSASDQVLVRVLSLSNV